MNQVKKIINNHSLFFFNLFFFLYLEILFHITCFHKIGMYRFLSIVLFTIPFVFFYSFFLSFWKEKTQKIGSILFLILFTVFFLGEFVCFSIFKAFFGFHSLGLYSQVFVVFDEVLTVLFRNIFLVFLFLLPSFFFFFFFKKINFKRKEKKEKKSLLFLGIFFYGLSLISLFYNRSSIYCNYNLYYKINQPILTANHLGLLTSFRLDVQRSILPFKQEAMIFTGENPTLEDGVAYNITNINFEYLNTLTENENILKLNHFFENRQATKKNEYTGLFRDKNLIFIIAESLDKSVIREDLTPTLYRLVQESIQFSNYYTPLFPGSTGSAEYMSTWGLLASNVAKEDQLSQTIGHTNPFRLNNSLKELGYKTFAYHDYYGTFYNREEYFKSDGYDDYAFCGSGSVETCEDFHGSDLEMMQNTIERYSQEDKFFTYYMTVSGHGEYDLENPLVQKNYDLVKDLEYSSVLKNYMAATIELDRALAYLMTTLEDKGILKDTVIVVTPDHYPYYMSAEELNVLEEEDRTDKFLMHHQNLIIWNQDRSAIQVEKYISNIDILPTLLNLFGVEYDSRLFIGRDALSDSSSTVILPDQSWINLNGSYDTVHEVFLNKKDMNENYVEYMNKKVNTYFTVSNLIQKEKYYQFLFKE